MIIKIMYITHRSKGFAIREQYSNTYLKQLQNFYAIKIANDSLFQVHKAMFYLRFWQFVRDNVVLVVKKNGKKDIETKDLFPQQLKSIL